MKFRLTIIAAALSALAIAPVYAGGAGGCDYGSQYRSTSVDPQEPSEASKKLASLSVPIKEQEKAEASTSQAPETASAQ